MSYQPSGGRYNAMEYRRCGASGLKLPVVSFGLWHNFGDTGDYGTMKEMLFTAFDHGITHFDLGRRPAPPNAISERS